MALMAILRTLDGLSDDVKKEYAERDGKHFLQVTPVDGHALEDVSGLKSALGAEKKEKQDALQKLKGFKDLDPEAAREALAKVEEMGGWTPEQKVTEKIESMKKQLAAEHLKVTSDKDAKIASLTKEFEKLLVVAAATEAIANKKGKIKGLMPHVKAATKMRIAENGAAVVEVIDAAGNPRVGDAKGTLMTIEQLVDEFAEDDELKGLFDGSGATGSGATGATEGGTTSGGETDQALPPVEKMKVARRAKEGK